MKYIVTLNGKKYEVEVEKGQATAVYAGVAEPITIQAPQTAPPQQQAPQIEQSAPPQQQAPQGAGEPIQAPMTGSIIQIKCSVGQAVKEGDLLFILEAMKMENAIVSPRDGKISSIAVSKGASVETGTILCMME